MIQTSRLVFDILRVRAVQPDDMGTRVTFENGSSAVVTGTNPIAVRIVSLAEASASNSALVGMMIGEGGELLQLSCTHQSSVNYARPDDEDPTRMIVSFWAYSPICYLSLDHPDFDRVRNILENAATTGLPVVLANHMNMVENDTELWWKLLDVRPVSA